MKKRVLKDWVVMVLGFINIIAIMVLASDCDNIHNFLVTHIIALVVFVFNATIITKYGKTELFK